MAVQQQIPNLVLQFFDTFAEAVVVANASADVIYVNRTFCRLTHFDANDVIGLKEKNIFKVKINYHLVESLKVTHWESGVATKSGDQIWVKVSASPLYYNNEELTVFTLVENPSIEQLKGLLKESENRFASLADASPVMIWMTDQDNLCYYFNKSWLDFTGQKFEDEVGTGWLQRVHEKDLPNFNAVTEQLNNHEGYSLEYRLRRKDGAYRNVLEIGTPRLLPDGTFAGYMGSCLDITEFKAVQNELANYTEELKRSNEELEQFAYVASHDMQEPLRMIASYIQLIKRSIESGKTTDEVFDFMKFVLDGVARMQLLINDLLQFSRLNKKGMPFTEVDLNEVVKVAITNLTNRIAENHAIVTYTPMPVVNGDVSQLTRLIQNLVDNAIKFKSAERTPEISISVKERETDYVISVKDNGIGIENKFYNRIFVIFQRLHTRNEYEGTGIGLAVCRKIVERHGGEIWVESEFGAGSCFYFSIKK